MNTQETFLNFADTVKSPGPVRGDICTVNLGPKVLAEDWDYILRGIRPCIVLKVIGCRIEILPLTTNSVYNTGLVISIPSSTTWSYPRYDSITTVNVSKLSPINGANIITTFGIDAFNSIIDRIANFLKSNNCHAPKHEEVHQDTIIPIITAIPEKAHPIIYDDLKEPIPIPDKISKTKTIVKHLTKEEYDIVSGPLCTRKLLAKYGEEFVLTTIQTMSSTAAAEVFGISTSNFNRVKSVFKEIGISPIKKPYRKTTKEDRAGIMQQYNNGVSVNKLSKESGLTVGTIYNIISKNGISREE